MGAESSRTARAWEIDALRGLMLVLMTSTHLPTRFAGPLGQPFGFVSAAEGFVLLSGFMAGTVYMKRHQRHGEAEMRSAFLKRVAKIYLWQVALLLFLCSVIAFIGAARQEDAIVNLVSYYLDEPLAAFVGGLILLYNPPLLDILPMYVLFMLLSAPLLVHGARNGWKPILAASVVIWFAAQLGAGEALYQWLAELTRTRVPPLAQTGSFSIAAWQLLWVIGLWMGATGVVTAPGDAAATPRRFPRWLVLAALAIALVGLTWRHAVGQAPFGANRELAFLFDKWHLGPLRLVNLFALMVLAIHYAPLLKRRLPRVRALETLGAQSLAVFIAHLAIALVALAYLDAANPERPLWIDVALFAGTYAVLYAVGWLAREMDRRSAAARTRARQWAQGRRALISRRHSA
jgi:hypothetical protein